jgi:prepilin-type N-terminal cleavage/methylation domain-containing protein
VVYVQGIMNSKKWEWQKKCKGAKGFSLTELVVTMAVALVLIAVGMPSFLRAYHSYQLTNSASQLADILRLTRYEAIQHNVNTPENSVLKPDAGDPTITDAFADANGNNNPDPTEKMILLGSGGNVVSGGGIPGTAGMLGAAKVTSAPIVATPGAFSVAFDSRGALTSGNVTVFYLASGLAPEAGYRAVILLPAGSIQIWSGDVNGNWGQLR